MERIPGMGHGEGVMIVHAGNYNMTNEKFLVDIYFLKY